MRVIAGSRGSLRLQTPAGNGTRPTQDRIKETLFNMIHDEIPGVVFLDLFAGSGGIGIEALSRGAKKCYFVEKEKSAISCIEQNLRTTKFTEEGILLKQDVFMAIGGSVREHIDLVFMDPPYNKELEKKVLTSFREKSDIYDENTLIIIEASLETNFDYLGELGYELVRVKKYKTNQHVFVRPARKG